MSPKMTRSQHDYTVACICPMGVELAPVRALLDEIHDSLPTTRDQNAYVLGRIGKHNVVVTVLMEIGTNMAATVATQLMNDFPAIRFGLLVGIGGAVPGADLEEKHDVRLGDVVVSYAKDLSGGVVQYDLGKSIMVRHHDTQPRRYFRRTGHLNKPPPVLRGTVQMLRAQHELEESKISTYLSEMMRRYPKMRGKYRIPDINTCPDRLFLASYLHKDTGGSNCSQCDSTYERKRSNRPSREPYIHYGTIGSANMVVRDATLRDELRKDMDILCVEMEAAGLMDSFPCLVIRGICDYADSHKNKGWQPYAAAVAAAYMKELLLTIPPHSVLQTTSAKDVIVADPQARELLSKVVKAQEQIYSQTQEQSQQKEVRYRREEDEQCHRIFKTTDYEGQKDRNPRRVEGTCRWVLEHPLFQQWQSDDRGRLLWISADPGCGKSVLARSLVDHQSRPGHNTGGETTTVCYFFFKDNQEQDRLAVALCAILHQLFCQQPQLLNHAIVVQKQGGDKIRHECLALWKIFQAALADPIARPVICVFDAMDECQDDDRQTLIEWLCDYHRQALDTKSISSNTYKSKFLVTSRPYDSVERWFGTLPDEMPEIRVRGEEENEQLQQEINLVVNHHVNRLAAEFSLSDVSQKRLRQNLHAMQHRTYLWLYLSIEAVRDAFHDSMDPEEVKIGQIIPKDVEDAYEKILQSVKPTQKSIVRQILLIIVGSRRALSVGEMATALETAQQLNGSDTSKINCNHLERHIREWCRLFIFINHSKLYLIHQTAKEFLVRFERNGHQSQVGFSPAPDPHDWKWSLTMSSVGKQMARLCVEYLYQTLSVSQSLEHSEFFQYCAEHWLWHFQDDFTQDSFPIHQVLYLYDAKGKAFRSWFPVMWKAYKGYHENPLVSGLHIAAMCSHFHIMTRMLQMPDVDIEARDRNEETALIWATRSGKYQVVKGLIEHGADVNAQNDSHSSAIHIAAAAGHEQIVDMLIDLGADLDLESSLHGTALQAASYGGHVRIVQTLIDQGVNINASGYQIGSALEAASGAGHSQVVQMLLDQGANVDVKSDALGFPLQAASAEGHEQIVQILINRGAHINAQGAMYANALQAAAKFGHENIVQILLGRKADVNAQGGVCGCALIAAAEGGHQQIIQLLLDQGAEVDLQGDNEMTALQRASLEGCDGIVQILIDHKANINKRTEQYSNCLQAAAEGGHIQIARLLMDMGANVNAQGGYYGDALQAACVEGHEQMAQLLIDRGANVNQRGGTYGNALLAASVGGCKRIVQTLIDLGADVNVSCSIYCTPLQAASDRGCEEIVQMLLDHGANVNALGGLNGGAIQSAAASGHEQVVKVLIEYGAEINGHGSDDASPICWASIGGHAQIVQILIEQGADFKNESAPGWGNPLHAAAVEGHTEIVGILLDNGVDVNIQGGSYNTALQAASAEGYDQIVRRLIDHGADVNAKGGTYGTALQAASAGGYEWIIQMLLDDGASVDVEGGKFGTALQAATYKGCNWAVRALITHGADINAQGGRFGTAIQAGSYKGYEHVVLTLIIYGADVNLAGGEYGTAIQAAAAQGHKRVVQGLIDHGADVNSRGGRYGSALQAAKQMGHDQVVQILIEHNAV